MNRHSLQLKYVLPLVLFYMIPLWVDTPGGQLDIIWLIYLLPVIISTCYLGITGGITTAVLSSCLQIGWELREHYFEDQVYNHYNFVTMMFIDLTLLIVAIGFGRLFQQIRGEREFRTTVNKTLQSSKEIFAKAFGASPIPMAISKFSDSNFVEVNNSWEVLTGYSKQEAIGNTSRELNIISNFRKQLNIDSRLMNEGSVRNCEANIVTKDGENKTCLFSFELVELNNELHILSACQDITEIKKIQAEMARLDRLNLIGVMAAGLGHEIRNPLTTVRGFLQLMGSSERFADVKEHFDLMISELDQANAIITEFLSLAKTRSTDLEEQDINEIVKKLEPLISADAVCKDKTVSLELNRIPALTVNGKEMRQLLLNLIRNGLEAMKEGGVLTVRTFLEKDSVVLAVRDQGQGISMELLPKLGTPFWTTKDTGTGLGLAVCYGIAERHNAVIEVETSPKGTTFYVKFQSPQQSACA